MSDVLTSKEVMEILDISKETLYKQIKWGRIPAFKVDNKSWRFNKKQFIDKVLTTEDKYDNFDWTMCL
ncbi:MAG: helix-turn-helix domain-containing protein [Lachnoclostridium sp.]|nr:helix-turn-helix domain-containing protein [Lachnoclostridium sp.]